ncbi:MAG: coproporphyrinogen III oxidase family protein [Kiritimatiellae bacterium]|nr:coproporphyrinogen III oxidase family protein [Kiritimatiellia bacterium]
MNLYVHFPFCRAKCTYCALHSRGGSTAAERAAYVARLAAVVRDRLPATPLETVYFGGGTPALCDLAPLLDALAPRLAPGAEFTVELHPRDVTRATLQTLKDGGVNRISMGVQSLDDDILKHMARGYTFHDAERAFGLVKDYFDNAGIDLIVGYPGETAALLPRHARLANWGLAHCSVYSLILEEQSRLFRLLSGDGQAALDQPPSDETVLDRLAAVARFLAELGLQRYEISSYAVPGRECRHNLATWRGEDYIGLGEGAHGRIGRIRTQNWMGEDLAAFEQVSEESDRMERLLFRLRTRDGLDATLLRGDGQAVLERNREAGLLTRDGTIYRLTARGTEVCDAILTELV